MIKQRWRKTKKKMKPWNCDMCGAPIKVQKEYEPEYCCHGHECGCYGMPIDHMFCDSCSHEYLGTPIRRSAQA